MPSGGYQQTKHLCRVKASKEQPRRLVTHDGVQPTAARAVVQLRGRREDGAYLWHSGGYTRVVHSGGYTRWHSGGTVRWHSKWHLTALGGFQR